MKIRLDKAMVERGLVGSRERAQALILAGRVLVAEQRIEKPGSAIDAEATLRILGQHLRYVSRGGLKLEAALDYWNIELVGRTCIDVGASTGGFTDCMLQRGAQHVLAVDTGYGQIAHKLRVDPRVTLMERCNARLLRSAELIGKTATAVSFLAMDVSFISATLVIPAVVAALAEENESWRGEAAILVKPQFEAGREHVGKGGIVRDESARQLAIERVWECVVANGGTEVHVTDSPITGAEGNREYLLHALFHG